MAVTERSFGKVTYLIYKRFEPAGPLPAALLLLALPSSLAIVERHHFSNILTAVLYTHSVYWALILTCLVTYRLSPFHPLASIPGPLPCKVSKLWLSSRVATGKQHLYMQGLHKLYGHVVRIGTSLESGAILNWCLNRVVGPNEISFCEGEAVLPIMGPKGLPKGPCNLLSVRPL